VLQLHCLACRCLELTACGLRVVPARVAALPALRTLLLGHNQLSAACPATCQGGIHSQQPCGAGAPPAPYSVHLVRLELQHNPGMPLPLAAAQCCAALEHLDLTGSCVMSSDLDWQQLLGMLAPRCSCVRTCQRLATDEQLASGEELPGEGEVAVPGGSGAGRGAFQQQDWGDPSGEPLEGLLSLTQAAAAAAAAAASEGGA
jgi:hypothetical protein